MKLKFITIFLFISTCLSPPQKTFMDIDAEEALRNNVSKCHIKATRREKVIATYTYTELFTQGYERGEYDYFIADDTEANVFKLNFLEHRDKIYRIDDCIMKDFMEHDRKYNYKIPREIITKDKYILFNRTEDMVGLIKEVYLKRDGKFITINVEDYLKKHGPSDPNHQPFKELFFRLEVMGDDYAREPGNWRKE